VNLIKINTKYLIKNKYYLSLKTNLNNLITHWHNSKFVQYNNNYYMLKIVKLQIFYISSGAPVIPQYTI